MHFYFANNRNISIFVVSNHYNMKYNELHRLIRQRGWRQISRKLRGKGSHVIYEKDGRTYPVPDHGSAEIGKGLEMKIKREMGL